jgi:hypothetical protein
MATTVAPTGIFDPVTVMPMRKSVVDMERAVTAVVVEQVPVAVSVPCTPARLGAKPATRYWGRNRFSVVVEGEKVLCTTPDCAMMDAVNWMNCLSAKLISSFSMTPLAYE